jgi:hypothetical protein
MFPSSCVLNMIRSVHRHLETRLGAVYRLCFMEREDLTGLTKWIEPHWLRIGPGIASVSVLQLSLFSVVSEDPYLTDLRKMHDEVMEEMNVDSIPMYDFEALDGPVPLWVPVIPRYRGTERVPGKADSVEGLAMTYEVRVWREDVLA